MVETSFDRDKAQGRNQSDPKGLVKLVTNDWKWNDFYVILASNHIALFPWPEIATFWLERYRHEKKYKQRNYGSFKNTESVI